MIAVTGASGFIGRQLCGALAAEGRRVIAVHRDGAPLAAGGVASSLISDITDRAALARGFAGATTVVHLAGRAHGQVAAGADPLGELRRVNVEGTVAVVEAAADAGVRRVLIASSVKAVGEGDPVVWTEETTPAPTDPYGISKLEAERAGLAAGGRRGCEVVVLRLPLVYGPGAPANVLRLLRLVDRAWPLPFGAIHNRRSMLATGNFVAAVRAVSTTPGLGGETFFVADAVAPSTPDLVRMIAAALGRPVRLFPIPVALLRGIGAVSSFAGRAIRLPLNSGDIDRLVGSLVVSTGKLTRRTGFAPPLTPEQGWRETATWFRSPACSRP